MVHCFSGVADSAFLRKNLTFSILKKWDFIGLDFK